MVHKLSPRCLTSIAALQLCGAIVLRASCASLHDVHSNASCATRVTADGCSLRTSLLLHRFARSSPKTVRSASRTSSFQAADVNLLQQLGARPVKLVGSDQACTYSHKAHRAKAVVFGAASPPDGGIPSQT